MITIYKNLKSELTSVKEGYERLGYTVFRTRTQCQYTGKGNQRNALLVVHNNQIIETTIRCKACRKEADNE